ncbi:hypothetical protein B0H16DRAFT_554510 [Mycena metata]|uniref:Uncharacterized protein n=1 Tax=Mycena metata TaxID=1033252 RepID=A0AAD7MDW2_9AGAR|nr:hypothetical protein B0H16DRAFT_554510 [Mycena metata]
MATVVWETVIAFGLEGRITAFVMDNATNNDTMVAAFADRSREAGYPFSAINGRMRCMPHTIHLSALKAIGALTKEESKKSQSRQGGYQEATTESLSAQRDAEATQTEDSPESTAIGPASAVGKAVFKPPAAQDMAEGGCSLV